jgi:hypothetical protein
MAHEANQRHSFIVRIWRESPDQEWKGSVEHAASRESALLQDLADLIGFIERYKDPIGPGALRESAPKQARRKASLK